MQPGWVMSAGALAGASVRMAVPLLYAAQGELVAERSGVINIGVEGLMLAGAFAGAVVAAGAGSPWVGLLAGVATGAAVAAAFGLLVIYARVDQVVAGIALNLAALGLTGVLYHAGAEGGAGWLRWVTGPAPTFRDVAVPGLVRIPV